MTVRIERASANDLPHILDLLSSSQLTAEGLTDHLATSLVARDRAAIVGTVTLEIYPEGALLRSLAVEPAARGQRVGHRLVDESVTVARNLGLPAVYLLTITAEQFFPRFGFERINRADVPGTLMRSAEFAYACPPSSIVMRKFLRPL
jgi:amino-acid N-acetyltransferase